MRTHSFLALLSLTLPGLGSLSRAQEPAPAVKVGTAPLVVKTTQADFAERLLRQSGQELPEIGAGEHYVLTMSGESGFAAGKGSGAVAFVEVEAQPKVLMELFADQVDQARRTAKMMSGMMAASSPATPVDMAKLVDAMFDFPMQIETLTLRVEGEEQKGWDAHAEFLPVAKSYLESMAQGLETSGKGVPRLGDGVFTMGFDLAPKALTAGMGAFTSLIMAKVPEEDRGTLRRLLDEQMAACDGTMAMSMRENNVSMVLGCSDAAAMGKLLTGGDWAKLQKAFVAAMPDAEVKVETTKIGDLDVVHTVGDLGSGSAFTEGGKIDGFATVANNLLVSVVNGGQKAFEDLAQRAIAGTLQRSPLARGAIVTMGMHLADMMAMSGQEAPEGLPDTVNVDLAKKGKGTLVLDVHIRM